ncbi:LysR family transcriptional regulator [Ectobacillus panaciterrae]|uniref:LysR family transcriptional regulator n=1 Tax=Ectobacillus panaciterrae TaxID=363872 RepID=UPI000408BD2C|nr:LysR family transcriptional regulator [Ectobacillus panaciterrae]
MELKWLETFVSAARTENFRQTSNELYISQPTVTVHIKLLEEHLGCRLFDRTGRKVKLTEEGRLFLSHAKELMRVHEAGVQELQSYIQGYRKRLDIAVSPLIAASIIPFLLARYVEAFPEVEVNVQVLESKDIASAVLNDEVHIGFSRMHVNHQELACTVLAEDKVILVSPHDGRDSESAPPLELEDVLQQYIILTHNHPEYWDNLLGQVKRQYKNVRTMVVSQVHVTKRFIEEGFGISFLPETTVRRELLEGRLLEVHCKDIVLPTARTYAVAKHQRSAGNAFLEFISQFRLS